MMIVRPSGHPLIQDSLIHQLLIRIEYSTYVAPKCRVVMLAATWDLKLPYAHKNFNQCSPQGSGHYAVISRDFVDITM